ncbi:MAG: hypothetical protein CMP23_00155 [Rickettsiales bacterium]|nr:hypothetical protein [Rickettsiales bacterium]|tara:strand:- start:923 stop:1903 length:981 start_codon:yes stop_codon:yes gene_type:complete
MTIHRRSLLSAAAISWLFVGFSGCQQERPRQEYEPVVVTSQVERAEVIPGRPFEFQLEVNKEKGIEFEVPDVGAGIEGLVIMGLREEGPEVIDDRVLTRNIYKLKAPLSGTYLIPGVEGLWRDQKGDKGSAGSGPILIEAKHAAGEEGSGEQQLRDLKVPLRPERDLRPAAGTLLVLLVLAVLLWLVKRRRQAAHVEAPQPAHEIALQDLQQLLGSPLLTNAEQGPFAYAVSAILRRYLEASFDFPAWRMTTSEVLRSMPKNLLEQHRLEAAIRDVLEASDRVKFAGDRVPELNLRNWVEQSILVVNSTAPFDRAEPAQDSGELAS